MRLEEKITKRDYIIRSALELIAEHGFHGAPMATIADRAGVGAGTIYRYFPNKDVLITSIYREVEEKVHAFLQVGYSSEWSFRQRFLYLGSKLLRYLIDNPLHFRYLEQFHNSPYGEACRRERILGNTAGCDIFREFFEEGLTRQAVKDLPLTAIFALAFGPLVFVARDHILGFIKLDDNLIGKVIDSCWDAIKQ